MKDSGDSLLEQGRCCLETKWENSPLVLGIRKTESCFVSITRMDTNLLESAFEIEFGENVGTR